MIDRVKWVKETYPHIQVIGEQHRHCQSRIGWSPVKTRMPSKSVSVRDRFALSVSWQVSACRLWPPFTTLPKPSKARAFPLIADGGVRFSGGDIAKALAAGALQRHARRYVCRHGRSAGRNRALLPRPLVQILSRYGFLGRDEARLLPTAASETKPTAQTNTSPGGIRKAAFLTKARLSNTSSTSC